MIDFKLEAERLMAATMPNSEGGIGMKLSEFRDVYGDRPNIAEERDLIALRLEDFLRRSIRELEEEQARAYYERVFKELERQKPKGNC